MTGRAGSFERRFPARPVSVGDARRAVVELLSGQDRDDLVETAELLVSELVTNALVHAGTAIDVAASLDETGLRVEVADGSPHFPVRRRYAPTAGTGRGMMMLEAMVDAWGVARRSGGKAVWFLISHADEGGESVTELRMDESGELTASATVDVTLLNVPLLLHAAWQEHAATLLREYLLASMDLDEDDRAIRLHAEATDAMAILEQYIPRTEVIMVADRLMRDAIDPHVSCGRVDVEVPTASVAHFRTLQETIEAALAMSAEGLFLTPPTQPEIQAFRRWCCHQVLSQAQGAQPERWSVEQASPTTSQRLWDWDDSAVVEAAGAVLAADDANYILAVSRSGLHLLGYQDPAELVGRRIIAIIPERFRQAHVAGFTMYFLTGRQPLLGRPVTVPALRRDGTEVLVELLVEAQQADGGREVFVATMQAAETAPGG